MNIKFRYALIVTALTVIPTHTLAQVTTEQAVAEATAAAICKALEDNDIDRLHALWGFLADSGITQVAINSSCMTPGPASASTPVASTSGAANDGKGDGSATGKGPAAKNGKSEPKGDDKTESEKVNEELLKVTAKGLNESIQNGNEKAADRFLDILKEIKAEDTPVDIGWGAAARGKDGEKEDNEPDKDFNFELYAGIEGTTIQSLKEEANVRAGFTAYNQFMRFKPHIPKVGRSNWLREDCNKGKNKLPDCGFGIGLHGWLSGVLTSSAEQTVAVSEMENDASMEDPMMENMSEQEPDIENAFEAELGVFVPVFGKKADKYGNLLVGPTVQTSLVRVGDVDRFTKRHYGGLRFAYSPETYVDTLYGKTEGLDGRRAEVKFQFPLNRLKGGGRIFWGGAINVGVEGNDREEPDSIRLFVTANTNIQGLLGD